jgi:L-ascorbate metabolism protein UlaG (beta-lactamase superfamily)
MLELWWLGQSGFRLRDPAGGPTLFCDPFLSEDKDRTWQAPLQAAGLAEQADLILVSHEHIDHLDRPTLRAAGQASGARFTVVAPEPIVSEILALGMPPERVVGAHPDAVVEASGVRVHPVPACHGVNVSDAYTFGEDLSGGLVRYLGYVFEIGGVRVYHAGDCIPYAGQTERLRGLRPQVACLPINGRDYFRESERNIVGNMDFREAARLAQDIGAEVLVPMHWELFEHNRGFPGDLVRFAAEHVPGLTVLVMGRGARLSVLPSEV